MLDPAKSSDGNFAGTLIKASTSLKRIATIEVKQTSIRPSHTDL
jgi:hypothetical protein